MGRRAAREFAMKVLYQLEIRKDDQEEQIKMAIENETFKENEKEYVLGMILGVQKNLAHLDKLIGQYAKGWDLTRIPRVDLSVLRVAIYEICFREDIPYSVSVNEAVELAKKYCGDDAGAFINGVLSKILKMQTVTSEGDVPKEPPVLQE